MINDYPIMLYQVNFSGKGYDAKKFEGVVVYARTLMDEKVTLNGLEKPIELVNAIIEDYVRQNLSSFENLQLSSSSQIVLSQVELKEKMKLFGKEYGYDKRAFGFNICPNMDSINSTTTEAKDIDYTNVKLTGLTVYTRTISDEMRQTLQSCFANVVFYYPTIERWSEKHPILARITSTIKSIINLNNLKTTKNRYFLAYDIPKEYSGTQELQFSNQVDEALDEVPGMAIDVVPFSRSRTFTVQREDVTMQDIVDTLLRKIQSMHFALFCLDNTEDYIIQ